MRPDERGNSDPIGIMDSGAGGLTVLREVLRSLPQERVIYFADSGRLPYGPRPPEQIRTFVSQIVGFLEAKGAKAVVLACNTATAHALDHVRKTARVPVVGVIDAGVRALVRDPVRRAGLIATEGTVRSGAYHRAIAERLPGVELTAEACPEFVSLVEDGLQDEEAIAHVVEKHARVLREARVDALILGCTHFPLLRPWLEKALPGVRMVDPARETAEELRNLLAHEKLLSSARPHGLADYLEFYTTGSPEKLQKQIAVFLGLSGMPVHRVDESML